MEGKVVPCATPVRRDDKEELSACLTRIWADWQQLAPHLPAGAGDLPLPVGSHVNFAPYLCYLRHFDLHALGARVRAEFEAMSE
jgi:hypothetical protein